MKITLPVEFYVNCLLSSCAVAIGVMFFSLRTEAPVHSDVEQVHMLDISAILDTARVSPATIDSSPRFLEPVDGRERIYNEMRHAAFNLSDREILTRYNAAWTGLAAFKDGVAGLRLPEVLAQTQAMELHALWREIQQRGLAPRVLAPAFDVIWAFLLSDATAKDLRTL